MGDPSDPSFFSQAFKYPIEALGSIHLQQLRLENSNCEGFERGKRLERLVVAFAPSWHLFEGASPWRLAPDNYGSFWWPIMCFLHWPVYALSQVCLRMTKRVYMGTSTYRCIMLVLGTWVLEHNVTYALITYRFVVSNWRFSLTEDGGLENTEPQTVYFLLQIDAIPIQTLPRVETLPIDY